MDHRPTRMDFVLNSRAARLAVVVGNLIVTGLCCEFAASAQQPPAQRPDPGQDRKESLAVLAKIAASFEVRLDDTHKAKLDDKPAMRWTNTIGHATDAAMFFWMHDGRPVAVGTTFVTDNVVGHEFQSLALQPFQTRRGEKTVWQPREPGIQFELLKGAPSPAETARQRLTQIKTLARRFRAEAIKGPPAYQENDVYQLRLLTQPILRYQDPKVPELEGAVFVFAMDTDADVLLLIENRVRDGKGNWEYALARTNPFALKAWCDDTPVWSQERVQTIDPNLPYFNLAIGPFPRKENCYKCCVNVQTAGSYPLRRTRPWEFDFIWQPAHALASVATRQWELDHE